MGVEESVISPLPLRTSPQTGVPRTYDEIGNLLTDGTWTYTWRNGRELASMTDGTTTWNYTYDANGMRTRRSGNNVPHGYEYIYNGGSLSQVIVDQWQTLKFTYDANGIPMMVNYEGEEYYYVTNQQGDVVGITDSTGALVVSYTYDAWGKPLSITGAMADTLGVENPLRYRGYVYDQETGLYYLQSRYYDPEIGRFINADGFVATGQGMLSNNMFAYCLNNPVNQVDPLGTASYENSYTAIMDNGKVVGYDVTTIIKLGRAKLTYRYTITARGVIQFDFGENAYRILSRFGKEKLLAEAMYTQAKAINSNYLSDRTIEGLRIELQGHWLAYVITGQDRVRVADMGTAIKDQTGYDSNAWVWEGGSTLKTIVKGSALVAAGLIANICNMLR